MIFPNLVSHSGISRLLGPKSGSDFLTIRRPFPGVRLVKFSRGFHCETSFVNAGKRPGRGFFEVWTWPMSPYLNHLMRVVG